jgi:hypothetical protein
VAVTFSDVVSKLTVDGGDTLDHNTALREEFNWLTCRKLIIVGIPQPSAADVTKHAQTIFDTLKPTPEQIEYAEWELSDGVIVAVLGKALAKTRGKRYPLEVEYMISRKLRETPPS